MDTSRVVKADERGCIEGLYGNKLHVNPEWSNPSGKAPLNSADVSDASFCPHQTGLPMTTSHTLRLGAHH